LELYIYMVLSKSHLISWVQLKCCVFISIHLQITQTLQHSVSGNAVTSSLLRTSTVWKCSISRSHLLLWLCGFCLHMNDQRKHLFWNGKFISVSVYVSHALYLLQAWCECLRLTGNSPLWWLSYKNTIIVIIFISIISIIIIIIIVTLSVLAATAAAAVVVVVGVGIVVIELLFSSS
jgi:hypothetical protein